MNEAPARKEKSRSAGSNGAVAGANGINEESSIWTPTMIGIFVAVAAFFAGLFMGSEMHHPVIAPPASAAPGSGPDGSAAASSGSTSPPTSAGQEVAADPAALKASVESTNDPAQLQALGEAHLDQDPATAVLAFQKAIKLGSLTPTVYRGLGLAEMRLQRMPDALENLKKAVALNPHDVTSVIAMGLVQEKTPGGIPEARTSLQRALKLGPPGVLKQSVEAELKKLGGA